MPLFRCKLYPWLRLTLPESMETIRFVAGQYPPPGQTLDEATTAELRQVVERGLAPITEVDEELAAAQELLDRRDREAALRAAGV
jgi:hypothetical protein